MRRRILASTALPYKRRLAYLESTGTQYIDTGIYFEQSSTILPSFEIRVALVSLTETNPRVFGASNGTQIFQTFYSSTSFYIQPLANMSVVDSLRIAVSKSAFNSIRGYFDGSAWRAILNGSPISDSLQKGAINKIEIPMSLFGCTNSSGVVLHIAHAKIALFAYDDGFQKMRLIPVMSHDDEPCFHDEVSGKLFRNAGTGTFAYGELDAT